MSKTDPVIYKDMEFEKFIEYLEEGPAAHWNEVAEVLGVDKDTITYWRRYPRAVEARVKGLNHALKMMEKVGASDWKMWKEKANMLGVKAVDKTDITSDGEKIEGVVIYTPEKNKE